MQATAANKAYCQKSSVCHQMTSSSRRDSCTTGSRRPWAWPAAPSTPARPPSCLAVWLIVRHADGQILGDLGTHGPPDSEGCVAIGYSLAPSARGQGIGSAAVAALVRRLAAVPGMRRITAVTGAQNTASRRLLERQGSTSRIPFRTQTSTLPDTDELRYARNLS